jgi:1,4-dihydroxy-2-naphthoate octaprenyltransferase
MTERYYRLLYRFGWVFYIILIALLYALGAGIAHYLGALINLGLYIQGQLAILALYLAGYFLDQYFDETSAANRLGQKYLWGISWKSSMLLGVALFGASAASLSVLVIRYDSFTNITLTILSFLVVGGLLYTLPPIRLSETGFGELARAVLLVVLPPMFSYALITGSLHRLVAMSIFPLAVLHVATGIVLALPDYATHEKFERKNILTQMGWRNAMIIHNFLVISAFLLLGLAAVLGFPTFAAFPGLFSLPLGLGLVFYLNRISEGMPPNWNFLVLASVGLLGVMGYILAFAFWTH